jgi:hypothetical protein
LSFLPDISHKNEGVTKEAELSNYNQECICVLKKEKSYYSVTHGPRRVDVEENPKGENLVLLLL